MGIGHLSQVPGRTASSLINPPRHWNHQMVLCCKDQKVLKTAWLEPAIQPFQPFPRLVESPPSESRALSPNLPKAGWNHPIFGRRLTEIRHRAWFYVTPATIVDFCWLLWLFYPLARLGRWLKYFKNNIVGRKMKRVQKKNGVRFNVLGRWANWSYLVEKFSSGEFHKLNTNSLPLGSDRAEPARC